MTKFNQGKSNGYFSISIVVYFIHGAFERNGFFSLFIGVWDFVQSKSYS